MFIEDAVKQQATTISTAYYQTASDHKNNNKFIRQNAEYKNGKHV